MIRLATYRRVAVDVSTDEGVLPASIYVLAEPSQLSEAGVLIH